LQRGIELDRYLAETSRDQQCKCDEQAANHRRRNVVATEYRHRVAHAVTDEKCDATEGERLNQIE
jgi:hypothetical protein